MRNNEKAPPPRGDWANGAEGLPVSKQQGRQCTDIVRIAQPVGYGGSFLGWLIDRQNGQVEAAASLGGSLGWFNSGQAALNALILHQAAGGRDGPSA